LSSASCRDDNLSCKRLLILTSNRLKVNESTSLVWRNHKIPLSIVEEDKEWTPSFLVAKDVEKEATFLQGNVDLRKFIVARVGSGNKAADAAA
jgi:hypothetical protein